MENIGSSLWAASLDTLGFGKTGHDHHCDELSWMPGCRSVSFPHPVCAADPVPAQLCVSTTSVKPVLLLVVEKLGSKGQVRAVCFLDLHLFTRKGFAARAPQLDFGRRELCTLGRFLLEFFSHVLARTIPSLCLLALVTFAHPENLQASESFANFDFED